MKSAVEAFARRFTPPDADAIAISSLTGAADAFLALALAGKNRLVLAITPGLPDADRLADDLHLLTDDKQANAYSTRILEFPPPLNGDRTILGIRLKTLAALRAWSMSPHPCVVVAPYAAVAAPVPRNQPRPFELRCGGENAVPGLGELSDRLAKFGYRRVPQVENEGDFSVRGGILDAWSPGEEFPVRLEFFGDDLESMRKFNPGTQTSIERIDRAELWPVENPAEADESNRSSLLDLLPAGSSLLALEHNGYALSTLLGNGGDRRLSVVYTGDPAPKGVLTYDFQTSPLPGFSELGIGEAHHAELFEAARKRLQQHLGAARKAKTKVVQCDDLSGGFELPGLIVVTRSDRVFTRRRLRSRRVNVQAGERLQNFDDIEPGEYVVHLDHGIGRYLGSSILVVNGERHEVYNVEYADGAVLHVPASHAHLLSRYVGVKGEAVRMHRLDGKRWTKDRQNAQKAVRDLAAALLETQAKRETVPGFAYDIDCEGRDAFEAAFPFEETPDQTAAIAAVNRDLAATRPMDRLICGDAGYGKTEVAMRAAFIAAMNGRQVAVLAPTTVLAEQHFETFTARFDGTPVRIESVSRFQTGSVHRGTFARLANGVCDIVIGTHAILSPKIAFKNLGLIIIDEEQRFGVRHKEFLKNLRATADVLTLSATPIPRTLYLSMTGARDLSLLRSPPRERVAVDTRIVRDSDEVIKTAIGSEIARGGQVYFLHNRVLSLGKVERRLKALCPSARIVVAHGQMDSRTLARKMHNFERGQYDVLLSTTIVESGIDIPRANTIIVDQAERFGMADLYQLRGRVGRSSRQGYAYFLLPPSGDVDSEARERLNALKRHGGLGAGFNLAVRDLELRGAGNLLGAEQSGHIAAVGFGLYCQLLKRTVAMMRGEKVKDIVDVRINLEFTSPRLPSDYIEEDNLRLSMMRRFAEAQDRRDVDALEGELKDRFGPLPPDAREFVRVCRLRVLCAANGIGSVDATAERAIFRSAGTGEICKVVDLRGKTPARRLSELLNSLDSSANPGIHRRTGGFPCLP